MSFSVSDFTMDRKTFLTMAKDNSASPLSLKPNGQKKHSGHGQIPPDPAISRHVTQGSSPMEPSGTQHSSQLMGAGI
jgi:hypothetical protein